MPDRAYSMYNVPAFKSMTTGELSVAGTASAEFPAFFQQSRTCGPVDSAVNTASAEEGAVCGIDDSICFHFSYVTANDVERHTTASFDITLSCVYLFAYSVEFLNYLLFGSRSEQ